MLPRMKEASGAELYQAPNGCLRYDDLDRIVTGALAWERQLSMIAERLTPELKPG